VPLQVPKRVLLRFLAPPLLFLPLLLRLLWPLLKLLLWQLLRLLQYLLLQLMVLPWFYDCPHISNIVPSVEALSVSGNNLK
jgi:hypothetical protein